MFKSQPSTGWMLCSAVGGISSPQGFRILQESVIPVRAEPTQAIICKLDQNESCRKKFAYPLQLVGLCGVTATDKGQQTERSEFTRLG
jgi:hypothetical protein